jgi:hypothetical protein
MRVSISSFLLLRWNADAATMPRRVYKLALPHADAVPAGTPLKAQLPLPATRPYMIAGINAKQGVIRLV